MDPTNKLCKKLTAVRNSARLIRME